MLADPGRGTKEGRHVRAALPRSTEGAALAPRQADHVAVIDALLEAGADPTELPDPPTGNAALDALIVRRREA